MDAVKGVSCSAYLHAPIWERSVSNDEWFSKLKLTTKIFVSWVMTHDYRVLWIYESIITRKEMICCLKKLPFRDFCVWWSKNSLYVHNFVNFLATPNIYSYVPNSINVYFSLFARTSPSFSALVFYFWPALSLGSSLLLPTSGPVVDFLLFRFCLSNQCLIQCSLVLFGLVVVFLNQIFSVLSDCKFCVFDRLFNPSSCCNSNIVIGSSTYSDTLVSSLHFQ